MFRFLLITFALSFLTVSPAHAQKARASCEETCTKRCSVQTGSLIQRCSRRCIENCYQNRASKKR